MASNDFLVFAGNAQANVIAQGAYAGLAAQQMGFTTGPAVSAQLNKVWRQSSIMSSMLGSFISGQTGQNVTDDGTTGTILANYILALAATRYSSLRSITGVGYTYAQADAGKIILRTNGGSGVMTDTLPNPALALGTALTITNADSGALLVVAPAAGTQLDSGAGFFILGPAQTAVVASDGSTYHSIQRPTRCKLGTQPLTLFVSGTGNDSNTGLSSAQALRNPSTAVSRIINNFDNNYTNPVINVGAGNFSAGTVNVATVPLGATGLIIAGAGVASTTFSGVGQAAMTVNGGANVFISGVSFSATGSTSLFSNAGYGLAVTDASVQLTNCGLSTANIGIATSAGVLQMLGTPFTIAGGTYNTILQAGPGSNLIGVNATFFFSGVVSVTGAFGAAYGGGTLQIYGANFSGGFTGPRYSASLCGTINTAGQSTTWIPGSVAGTTTGGGVYA